MTSSFCHHCLNVFSFHSILWTSTPPSGCDRVAPTARTFQSHSSFKSELSHNKMLLKNTLICRIYIYIYIKKFSYIFFLHSTNNIYILKKKQWRVPLVKILHPSWPGQKPTKTKMYISFLRFYQKMHMKKDKPIVKNGESLIFTRQMTNW